MNTCDACAERPARWVEIDPSGQAPNVYTCERCLGYAEADPGESMTVVRLGG